MISIFQIYYRKSIESIMIARVFIVLIAMLCRLSVCSVKFQNFLTRSVGSIVSKDQSVTTLDEQIVFQGYRNIVRRKVILPNGQNATYDLLTQKHASVVVFTWDTLTSTTTLVNEYHPGPNKFISGTVAGMYEIDKHASPLESAMFELEEEAKLVSDKWYPLLDTSDTSMPFDKYSTNRFYPYLAIDCKHIDNGKDLDEQEYIIIERNVTYSKLMSLLHSGQMNVVSTYAILLGLRKLNELGIKVN